MRTTGYVIAGDVKRETGQTVWKVRVNDPASPHYEGKLIVASTHENITLARGLNVTFEIGSLNDQNGQPAPRAVDVRLQ